VKDKQNKPLVGGLLQQLYETLFPNNSKNNNNNNNNNYYYYYLLTANGLSPGGSGKCLDHLLEENKVISPGLTLIKFNPILAKCVR
jgi:hypothetical protein